jgi:DNA-directed RNA polymerase subunit RPC12/RpoP
MDTIRFRCPDCDQALKVKAEKAGRKVRCNRCTSVVVVPEEEATGEEADGIVVVEEETVPEPIAPRKKRARVEPPEDEPATEKEDEEPRPKRKANRKGRAAAWRLARLGLLLLLTGSALALLNTVGGAFLYLLSGRALLGSGYAVMVYGIVAAVVLGLIEVAGFTLCLFAPPETESKPFALMALIAMVLTQAMSGYLIATTFQSLQNTSVPGDGIDYSDPKAVERKIKEDSERLRERLRDPKEREKYQKETEERMKKLLEESNKGMKNLDGMMLRLSILRTVGSLLNGLSLISVPLLLRSFCRTLKLVELEPNCDGLLKIGAWMIGLDLAIRLLGVLLFSLLGLVLGLSMLLGLAYRGLSLVLVYQLWRAMPAPR